MRMEHKWTELEKQVEKLQAELAQTKAELEVERGFVNKIASQAITQKEFKDKGGDDYEETDHRGGYEYIVQDAREQVARRKG